MIYLYIGFFYLFKRLFLSKVVFFSHFVYLYTITRNVFCNPFVTLLTYFFVAFFRNSFCNR
nr:MAG TPA: hypothetical protein [Bacteriophage sp.]DAR64376.1 MAG TPA: hypothetical protein [Caudoviricetes sp.]